MSQAKVDKYKKEKANRQELIKKQKREDFLWKLGASCIGLVMLGWISFSAYNTVETKKVSQVTSETYEVNVEALSDYLADLSAEAGE